jgi:hypothetical protein
MSNEPLLGKPGRSAASPVLREKLGRVGSQAVPPEQFDPGDNDGGRADHRVERS